MQVPSGDGGHGGRVELDEGDVSLLACDLDLGDVPVQPEKVEKRLRGGDCGRDVADDQDSDDEEDNQLYSQDFERVLRGLVNMGAITGKKTWTGGWVDLNCECSNVCLILLKLTGSLAEATG